MKNKLLHLVTILLLVHERKILWLLMMVQLGLITAKTGGYKNPLIYTSKYNSYCKN